MPDLASPVDPVTAWLRGNAIPLGHLTAGNDFHDLQPLRDLWRDVDVVGLGESTHGTREFFQVKHRLLEFLVSEMGFTVFALEASHTACGPLNAWVQGGDGDVETLLSGIHYLAWHTEEFVVLVEWIRTWNANAPDDRKVRFLGADITYNERGRDAVLAYLRRVAPGKVPAVERSFAVLADGEAKWPLGIDDATNAAVADVLPTIDALIAWLDDNRSDLASRSSAPELDRIRFYLELMPHWWRGGAVGRTASIGDNLVFLLDRDHRGAKVVFWAHNGHVDAGTYPGGEPKAGHRLRERFGDRYYACALEFGEGSYQYRRIGSGPRLTDLTTGAVGPSPENSVPWRLAQAVPGDALVNLRRHSDEPAIRDWLANPQPFHGIGWASPEPPSGTAAYEDVTPGASFDGILHVARSTPARPTRTAREHAAKGERM